MLVISTEAAYCTALCWTVGFSKSDVRRKHTSVLSLWQDWRPLLLRCKLGVWMAFHWDAGAFPWIEYSFIWHEYKLLQWVDTIFWEEAYLPSHVPYQAHSLLCRCLNFTVFLSNLVLFLLPVSLLFIIMFYFSFPPHPLPISVHFPGSALFLFSGLLVIFAPWPFCTAGQLCFVTPPWQMLPITVRNMPSISPLILKRLKVQFSLPHYLAPSSNAHFENVSRHHQILPDSSWCCY